MLIDNLLKLGGKTISGVRILKRKGCDDTGFLRLDFTDGSHCVVVGGYGAYTGQSHDGYSTRIRAADEDLERKLQEIPPDFTHV